MVLVKREVHEHTETDMYWDCWAVSSMPYRPDANNVWIIVWNIIKAADNDVHHIRVNAMSGMMQ